MNLSGKVELANEVFTLEDKQEVICCKCDTDEKGDPIMRRKGEAFLAGAAHTPYNAGANYICKDHLDKDVIIVDSVTFSVVHRNPIQSGDVR